LIVIAYYLTKCNKCPIEIVPVAGLRVCSEEPIISSEPLVAPNATRDVIFRKQLMPTPALFA
jgi:hypothetical protein